MQIDDFRNIGANNPGHITGRSLTSGDNVAAGEQKAKESNGSEGSQVFLAADFNSRINNPGYDKNSIKDETLAEEIERKSAGFTDAETTKRNLSMAVAGFSVEDLNGAREEGYDTEEMEPDQIITVIDQIKMHLALGGQDISAMGGLDSSEIEDMTGSNASLSAAVQQALAAADLPAGDEMVADGVLAMKKVGELSGLLEPMTRATEYLVRNELEPTIENVYTAAFSQGIYVSEGSNITEEELDALMPQVEKIIEEADLPVNERQRDNAAWMLEKNIPVTADNLNYLNELQNAEPDLGTDRILGRITDSVAEGKRPQEAYILPGYSMRDAADSAYDTVINAADEQVFEVVDNDLPLTIENIRNVMDEESTAVIPEKLTQDKPENDLQEKHIRAMRVLEETRLVMTKQASFTLIKQGFSIDTTELSDVVDKLKELENSFYIKNLSPKGEVIDESDLSLRIDIFNETNTKTKELSEMPTVLLGRVPVIKDATLTDLHRQGASLSKLFADAGERYETMKTEIRRDLGDSMQKAFRNVDDILEDLGMETDESNRRAVRILAYNEQAITTDSVNLMKAGDELVSRTIKSLTPGVVAKMIQNGENPLNLSMQELKDKAEEIKAVSASDSAEEKFSRFLYKAQNQGELTPEERDAFIGVYRLIYQVEKTDGAVIGQLIAQGADITLKNLMTAVRTRKHENREYAIDDDFGFAEFNRSALSITEQIEMAFETNRMKDAGELATPLKLSQLGEDNYLEMTPDAFADALENMPDDPAEAELDREYDRQKRLEFEKAVKSEGRIYEILSEYDIAASPANLDAFSQLLFDRNGMYKKMFKQSDRNSDDADSTETSDDNEPLKDFADDFLDALSSPEDMQTVSQRFKEASERSMENMIAEEPTQTLDVRGLRTAMKQISLTTDMGSRSETYCIPVIIDDQVGNMTLKIVRGQQDNRGLVEMSVETEKMGAIKASFRFDGEQVRGAVTTALNASERRLSAVSERLSSSIEEAVGVPVSLELSQNRRLDSNSIFTDRFEGIVNGDEGERPAVQTKVLYGIAKSFIEGLRTI